MAARDFACGDKLLLVDILAAGLTKRAELPTATEGFHGPHRLPTLDAGAARGSQTRAGRTPFPVSLKTPQAIKGLVHTACVRLQAIPELVLEKHIHAYIHTYIHTHTYVSTRCSLSLSLSLSSPLPPSPVLFLPPPYRMQAEAAALADATLAARAAVGAAAPARGRPHAGPPADIQNTVKKLYRCCYHDHGDDDCM